MDGERGVRGVRGVLGVFGVLGVRIASEEEVENVGAVFSLFSLGLGLCVFVEDATGNAIDVAADAEDKATIVVLDVVNLTDRASETPIYPDPVV